jgi:hypothetical protein
MRWPHICLTFRYFTLILLFEFVQLQQQAYIDKDADNNQKRNKPRYLHLTTVMMTVPVQKATRR